MASLIRSNTAATSTNMVKVPRKGNSTTADQGTIGTDTGTFTGLALNSTLTKCAIDGGTAVVFTAIPLADGTGLAINPDFEGLAQAAIGTVLRAAGYINIDELSVSLAIVDATPDTFTVTVTQRGEATLTSIYIGSTKTLSRA